MIHGSKYIYQTLPRILTLWMDLGEEVILEEKEKQKTEQSTKYLAAKKEALHFLNTKCMKKLIDSVPPFYFVTAFSQLVSRIGHPNPSVYALLESMILNVLVHFPQQALWHMSSVSKSTKESRSSRCLTIFSKAKHATNGPQTKRGPTIRSLIQVMSARVCITLTL